MKKSHIPLIVLLFCLFFFFSSLSFAANNNWVNINGNVTYNGTPVCTMVLANGQYMFTCSGDGSFNLDVPLDPDTGQITVFAFCEGLAPLEQVIYPAEGQGMQIEMTAGEGGSGMDVTSTLTAINTTWVRLEGTVSYNGNPVCAMVLANGQYMFTCSGDGSYSLDVPLDNVGSITLFAFCSGLPPYKYVFTTNQINFNNDTDRDGYSISQGDCNNFDASIYPGATEICGDGVDQDCNGSDLVCQQKNNISGTWRGSWYSYHGVNGQITAKLNQNGTNVFGTMDITNTDCGNLYNLNITGSEASDNIYSLSVSTFCRGSRVTTNYTNGHLDGDSFSGYYAIYVDGRYYDSGTIVLYR